MMHFVFFQHLVFKNILSELEKRIYACTCVKCVYLKIHVNACGYKYLCRREVYMCFAKHYFLTYNEGKMYTFLLSTQQILM